MDRTYEVTIALPVYNVERYIRLSMESILAQTFDDIEFLVCDDCGTDHSIDIVHEYQQNHPRGKDIRIVRQPYNMGIGAGRNLLISEARGRYIYFMDPDDEIVPETISLLHEQAVKYDADMVYGSYEQIMLLDDNTTVHRFQYPAKTFLKENEFANYAFSRYDLVQANTWNFLIKVEVYRKNGIHYKHINFWEDFTTTIDLPTYATRVVLMPDITYKYYCRTGSLSNFQQRKHISKTEIQKTVDAMNLVKLNSERIKHKPYFPQRMYKVMMTHFYIVCSILKKEGTITPAFTKREMRDMMRSPLTLGETISLKGWRLKNLALYLLGVLPPALTVAAIRYVGKKKGLV